MRAQCFDDGAVPAFTLSCAGYRSNRNYTGGSISRGNLSFSIDDEVMAEIEHDDLVESWSAASKLSAEDAAQMAISAGERLADILEDGLDSSDLTEAVTDAAVVFLLAMRRQGILDPKRIPACTVMWNGQEHRERVFLGS